MAFDLRTLVLATMVSALFCCLVALSLWRQVRHRFDGTGYWALNFGLQAVGLVLLILRGHIPDWASMVVGNTAVVGGAIAGYAGLMRFVGRRGRQAHNVALLVAFALVHAYFALVRPDLSLRNLNLSVAMLIVGAQCAWLTLWQVDRAMRRLTALLGVCFVFLCVVCVIRIGEFFFAAHAARDYFESGSFQQAVMVAYNLLDLGLALGLVLMVNGRLASDISAQEQKYATAFRSAPYAITLTRLSDGSIVEVNDGFVAMTGYGAKEVQGRTTLDLQLWAREEDRNAVVEELKRAGSVRAMEYPFRAKSGASIEGLFSAEIVSVGNEPHALSSIADIGPLRRSQKEHEHMQTRLAQADRLASMGAVASGVAHEVNNPLASVIANVDCALQELDALADGAAASEAAGTGATERTAREAGSETTAAPVPLPLLREMGEWLRDAAASARRIKRIVRSLDALAVGAEAEAGAADVGACIAEASSVLRDELGKRVRVAAKVEEPLVVAVAEGHLLRVLVHVMRNAAQAIEAGRDEPADVRVLVERKGNRALVSVADDGCGIAPEHLERVFEPFFTTRPAGEGPGLGLAVARGIVAASGGEIEIRSELGEGTEVRISLPLAPARPELPRGEGGRRSEAP